MNWVILGMRKDMLWEVVESGILDSGVSCVGSETM
jgi:hypothetical protein